MRRIVTGLAGLKLEFRCDCMEPHIVSSAVNKCFMVKTCPLGFHYKLKITDPNTDKLERNWEVFQREIREDRRFAMRNPEPKILELLTDKLIRDRIASQIPNRFNLGTKKLLYAIIQTNNERAKNLVIEQLSKDYSTQYRRNRSELELLGYDFLRQHREFGWSLNTLDAALDDILSNPRRFKLNTSLNSTLNIPFSGGIAKSTWRSIAFGFDENATAMLEFVKSNSSRLTLTPEEKKERMKLYRDSLVPYTGRRGIAKPHPDRKSRERDLPWSITPFTDRRGHPKGRR